MPGVVLLAAAIVVNWIEHRRHKPTICSTTRRALPRPVSTLALGLGYAYLAIHVWRGYSPKETAAPTTARSGS